MWFKIANYQKLLTRLCQIMALPSFVLAFGFLMAFLIVGSVSVGAPSQQELLRSWMSENSVIHFSLDKKNNITKKHFIIIETKDLVKLYQARNFLPIWIDQDFQQKSIVKIAQEYMQTELLQHGLNPDDYLSYELNSLTLMSGDPQSWMYFEIMMSEAFLRMGKDLATGRLNFAQLEKEFKLKQVPFKLYDYLQSAMNAKTDIDFAVAMDKLAPQSTLYKKLRIVLAKLRGFLVNPEWLTNINLDTDIKYGFKNLNILRLRQRLNDLGYAVALGSPIFDDNFLVAVKEFQLLNGLLVDGIISKNGNFIHVLNKSLKSRIEQVQINLERLRFLPRKMEAQYAFVNTAFAEFKLIERDKTVQQFKTVVGKQTRRTPSKRDLIEEVILNPTWTVPISIFKKDKLDKIQTDVDYLKTHHIRVIGNNSIEYNPLDIDWSEVNVDSFPYQLVQQPGVNNSLGVVKFPLYKHADNIYLHDTNEKKFFEPEIYNRHKSSGCIRLEKPLELAEYLLKSSTETSWSLEMLKTLVPPAHSGEDLISYQLKTSKALPVYLMYLTVDVGDNGQLRFSDDIYGQDSRFMKLLNSTTKIDFAESISADQKMGSLLVAGEPGVSQLFAYVKAIPCQELSGRVQKASCRLDRAIALPINSEVDLAFGTYILGFENSIYPGFMRISEKPQKIQLEKIQLNNFVGKRSSANYRVVRDFAEILEKSKNPFQTYFVQQPVFSLAQYGFGGLYLKGSLQKDVSTRLSYRICESTVKLKSLSAEARGLCENAKVSNLLPTTEFFSSNKFNEKADGTFTEKWINEDVMDIVEVKHPYHLVAAPLKFGEFVSVFPGSYRVIDEEGKTVQKFTTEFKDVASEYKMLFIDYTEKSNEPDVNRSEDQNI